MSEWEGICPHCNNDLGDIELDEGMDCPHCGEFIDPEGYDQYSPWDEANEEYSRSRM